MENSFSRAGMFRKGRQHSNVRSIRTSFLSMATVINIPFFVAIKSSTGFGEIEVWDVDLADFASIKAFASRFEKEGGGHLDLLVMNSGITTIEFVETKDGWESQ